jgi:hypothetical protein
MCCVIVCSVVFKNVERVAALRTRWGCVRCGPLCTLCRRRRLHPFHSQLCLCLTSPSILCRFNLCLCLCLCLTHLCSSFKLLFGLCVCRSFAAAASAPTHLLVPNTQHTNACIHRAIDISLENPPHISLFPAFCLYPQKLYPAFALLSFSVSFDYSFLILSLSPSDSHKENSIPRRKK